MEKLFVQRGAKIEEKKVGEGAELHRQPSSGIRSRWQAGLSTTTHLCATLRLQRSPPDTTPLPVRRVRPKQKSKTNA